MKHTPAPLRRGFSEKINGESVKASGLCLLHKHSPENFMPENLWNLTYFCREEI